MDVFSILLACWFACDMFIIFIIFIAWFFKFDDGSKQDNMEIFPAGTPTSEKLKMYLTFLVILILGPISIVAGAVALNEIF